jgi:hypothetical protein
MAGIVIEKWTKTGRVNRQAVECPLGGNPDVVAKEAGGRLIAYYDRIEDARFSIANDPNGKPAWGWANWR